MADKKKILIADDFQLLREDLTELINNQRDMEVVGTASSGKEIVNLARNTEYDLILMDMGLPFMDGYATTMGIRQLREDGRTVPVIALSSRLYADDEFHGEEYGMKARLQKPVSERKLMEALREYI